MEQKGPRCVCVCECKLKGVNGQRSGVIRYCLLLGTRELRGFATSSGSFPDGDADRVEGPGL